MKKVFLVLFAASLMGASAHAETGENKDKAKCSDIVQTIQQRLKTGGQADAGADVAPKEKKEGPAQSAE